MKPSSGFLMRESWRPDVVLAHKREFAGGRDAPGHVRAVVIGLLGDRLGTELLFDMGVLVSEVVTNAVRHGGANRHCIIVVHLALAPEVLRIEVCDQGPGFVAPRTPRRRAQGGGSGLVLLEHMSSRWGVAVDDGTCVWFERNLTPRDYVEKPAC
ncbi:MAG TPA: ATP-binding protein [Solirubrobacteraceae bacterium]|jgi:anti-sigma regulatory factor (Ser/Thr protein kinase)